MQDILKKIDKAVATNLVSEAEGKLIEDRPFTQKEAKAMAKKLLEIRNTIHPLVCELCKSGIENEK